MLRLGGRVGGTRPAVWCATVWCAAVLGGCANAVGDDDEVFDPRAPMTLDSGLILGALDWQEAATLPAGSSDRLAANAAGFVYIPVSSSRCSGFLIGPDVVMTNSHCVPDAAHAVGVEVNFRFETAWRWDDVVRCERFLGADATLDYALVGCEGRPGDRYGVLGLDDRVLADQTPIALLHQQCDWVRTPDCEPTKKVSPGKTTGVRSIHVSHDADSLGGSSGGAIIRAGTTRVVAINKSHSLPDLATGHAGANYGTPMSDIVPHLRGHFPGVLDPCAPFAATGVLVDEDDACATLTGNGANLSAIEGAGHGGDLVRAATAVDATNAAGVAAVEWRLLPAQAGDYQVSVFIDAEKPTTRRARYQLTHAGRTDTIDVDQAAVAASGFVVLGTFAFDASSDQRLRLDSITGEAGLALVFDAVRVAPASPPLPPAPPPPTICPQVRVTASPSLNVRAQPNTAQAPVGTLAAEEVVNRLQTAAGQDVRGNVDWHQIDKPGLTGWVSASYTICVE